MTAGNTTFDTLAKRDGVSGIVYHYFVSAFTLPNALAMTWDKQHMEDQYHAMADEFYGMGYSLMNAPQPGPLGRTPWGGRAMASFGPDPYLTGIALQQAVSGAAAGRVITHGKHFLLNEQETNRSSSSGSTAYSANADDKTLHELYMWPFADGIRAGIGAVMCAMNRYALYYCPSPFSGRSVAADMVQGQRHSVL